MRYSCVVLILTGLLAACSAPAQTNEPVSVTEFPTLTEIPAPTNTKVPVATVTETSAPTPQPTATPLSYPILATPQDPTDLANMEVDQWLETSPDGQWQAAGMVAWPKGDYYEYHEMLTVSHVSGSPEWVLVDVWHETGLGAAFPGPVAWSPDGQYFYFSNQVTPDGCALFAPRSLDLYRLALATGEVQAVLPGNYFGLSLSPDGGLAAGIQQVTGAFVIHDLGTGKEVDVNLDPGDDYDAGDVVWSPEGNQLALTLAIQPCNGDFAEPGLFATSSSVIVLDAHTGEVRTLIEEDDRKFETVAWDEPDWLTLRDMEGTLWSLNVETEELTLQ